MPVTKLTPLPANANEVGKADFPGGRDEIFIPASERSRSVDALVMPKRLRNILSAKKIKLIGDLHGKSYSEVAKYRNCGAKTLAGLWEVIRQLSFEREETASLPTDSVSAQSVAPSYPSDTIFIPPARRSYLIKGITMPAHLRRFFGEMNITLVGDLHGKNYHETVKSRRLGLGTRFAFQELLDQLQSVESVAFNWQPLLFVVPPSVHGLKLSDLPLSFRLERVLTEAGFRVLGDLDGVTVAELRELRSCGSKCIFELKEIIRRAGDGEFLLSPGTGDGIAMSLREAVRAIDAGIASLSERNRKICEQRLVGSENELRKLEDLSKEFKMSRERVRQIVGKAIRVRVVRGGGPKLAVALESILRECQERICPLTPEVFEHWLGDAGDLRHSIRFYVAVLEQMDERIPAWPTRSMINYDQPASQIERALEAWLKKHPSQPTGRDAYLELRGKPKFGNLTIGTFFNALRRSRRIEVEFATPEQMQLRRRKVGKKRIPIANFARAVLRKSRELLTAEEIVERAKARFGEERIVVKDIRRLGNSLKPENGFYRLDRNRMGIRQHIKTPKSRWPELWRAFKKVLHAEGRPVSTIETIEKKWIQGFDSINRYEMSQIIREKKCFTDLGYHLFALKEWGIKERQFINDILPNVLKKANRALSIKQIHARLNQMRSVTEQGIRQYVRAHPELRAFGWGYFGLKSWGDSKRDGMLRDRGVVEIAIGHATPPVSFGEVCRIFGVSVKSTQAGILWKTCCGSSTLERMPEKMSPKTIIRHIRFHNKDFTVSVRHPNGTKSRRNTYSRQSVTARATQPCARRSSKEP